MFVKNKYIIMTAVLGIIFCIMPLSVVGLTADNHKITKIDYILISKSQSKMSVYYKGKLLCKYSIALGFKPVGQKQFADDGKTPEGNYKIIAKNPNSKYHKSLKISYPNTKQIEFAQQHNKSPGGDIMIHGLERRFAWLGKAHTLLNWTKGCIAISNKEMDEIYHAVAIGAAVRIDP